MNLKISTKLLMMLAMMAGGAFKAEAQQVISLQKAVDLALANNLTIKQSQYTEALAAEDVNQSKYNLLPGINANAQGGYYFGKTQVAGAFAYSTQTFNASSNLSAQITLFQGGQLHNQILQNKLILDADKTGTAKVKNDLVLNVVTDYLAILTNQDLVTAAKQQIEIAKITLDRTQKSFDAGSLSLADLSQSKAGLSTAELNLTNTQNQLNLSILILKQYMEMDPKTDIVVERPDISKLTDIKTAYDANEVINTAFGVNPDVHLAEQNQAIYQQAIKIAQGNYYPTVALTGGAASSYSNQIPQAFSKQFFTSNFNQFIGLNVQIPIFNKFSARTAVRKAKLSFENAQVSTQLAKNNLSKTIIQAVFDLNAAVKRYSSTQQTYAADKDAFNIIQERYNVGLVNSLDYNTALTNVNKAENDMIESKYEVVFRSKVIDYYLGNQISL